MVIAVRTERGPDGLEVVKEAETDDDRVRLADEAAVLARAAHPGVVEVVDARDSILRLRHCGSPLGRLGPVAPDHAAAIIRAVAEIVDALHRQDIVHRRLNADHVVVSERGRPHLIGFGAAGDGDADAKADDVAALGSLLNRLLDDGADALWSPEHRGVRAATRRKRAMAAFRTAAAAAQRPEPGQRPSAHQFATAIGDALPGLTLPTPPGAETGPDGFAELPEDVDPTEDFGWSDFDLSFLAVDDDVVEPGSDVERNPAAPRDPYAVLESLASPEPEHDTDDARDEPEVESDPEPEPAHADADPVHDDDTDPIIAKLRAAMGATPAAADEPPPTEPLDAEPLDAGPLDTDTDAHTDAGEQRAEAEEPVAVVPAAAAARTLQPPSIQIRPGRADPTPDEPSGPGRKVLLAVAVVVLAVGAVAGSVIARAVDPFGSESAAADQTVATTTPDDPADGSDAEPTPPPVSDGCPELDLPGPDADNDGCPDPITLDGRVATVGNVAVELGEDGDQVVVADADCDGTATPVLLRPSTGEVFDFPGWSLDEAIEISSSAVIDGATSIETTDGPCPDVVVIDGAGDRVVVAS